MTDDKKILDELLDEKNGKIQALSEKVESLEHSLEQKNQQIQNLNNKIEEHAKTRPEEEIRTEVEKELRDKISKRLKLEVEAHSYNPEKDVSKMTDAKLIGYVEAHREMAKNEEEHAAARGGPKKDEKKEEKEANKPAKTPIPPSTETEEHSRSLKGNDRNEFRKILYS